MKRFASLIVLAILCLAPPIQAQQKENPSIVLTGTGTVNAAPDEGYITVSVTTKDAKSSGALRQNSKAMKGIYDNLAKFNVKANNLQTLQFGLSENLKMVYSPDPEDPKKQVATAVMDGYIVTNTIRVTVCEIEKFGDVLDTVANSGATNIQNISFGSSKANEYQAKAREAAVADALSRATLLTKGLNTKLGQVVSVQEAGVRNPRMMYEAASGARSADAVPVSGGSLSFSVSVTVQWTLEPAAPEVRPLFERVKPNLRP